jgi:3-oxoacyl-[acyl-carrier protein] reductase
MAEPDLSGVRVLLTGSAEPALVEVTREAFETVGSDVNLTLADASGLGGVEAPWVAIVFARRPSNVPILEADDAMLAEEVERQLLAPQRAAVMCARSMAAGAGGVIVLVGSVDAYHAYPGRSVPAIAMGGLLGLTRSLAVELAGSGVRANLVVAGPLGLEDGSAPPGAEPAAVDRALLRSPSHRFARPSEVAAAIRFVAGPDSAFMTGQTLRVDGGWASLNQAPEAMRFP